MRAALPLPVALCAALMLFLTGDTRSQAYPVTSVGGEEAILAPIGANLDQFGAGLATSGTLAAVGSPGANAQKGRVDVYERQGLVFAPLAVLVPESTLPRAAFGAALAMDGDTLAVGAPNPHHPSSSTGRVWIYKRVGNDFLLQQLLQPPTALLGDQFGRSLALRGDRLVVGAPYDDDLGAQSGSAFIYDRSAGSFGLTAQLLPSNGKAGDQFGRSVALSGNTAVVGAWLSDAAAIDGGATYAFVTTNGTAWTQQAQFPLTLVDPGDHVGESVAISGDHAFVGVPRDDTGLTDAGKVVHYKRTGSTWAVSATLQAAGPIANARFGCAVAASASLLIVGAPGGGTSKQGRATLYAQQTNGSYTLHSTFNPTAAPDSFFGDSVATGGTNLLVGAPTATGAVTGGGAVVNFPVTLAGVWANLGLGLAGTAGTPVLTGTGTMVANEPFSVTLAGGKPSSPVFLLLGLSRIDLPIHGGTLVPSPDFLIEGLATNGSGGLVFGGDWPIGHPGPFSAWFQIWFPDAGGVDGFAASNGLEAQVAP